VGCDDIRTILFP